MENGLEVLAASLERVSSARAFKDWVRFEFRPYLPHAAFLCTLGNLYGIGSVATHRLDVDFPLSIVEDLKNSAGALDDPLMYGWFRSERPKYVEILRVDEFGNQRRWREVLSSYGITGMAIHGVLDHNARRFAVFQLGNPYSGCSLETMRLFNSIVGLMAKAAWATVDSRVVITPRQLVGHPTLTLTPAELHIVELLAQGLSNKEIARLRGVSDSTVKTQVQRTGAKLGATRRAEIVAIAMPMLSPLPAQTLVDYGDPPFLDLS